MKTGEYVKKRIFQIKGSLSSEPSRVVQLGMIIYLKGAEPKSNMTDKESRLLGSTRILFLLFISLFSQTFLCRYLS
jgi:hypothetical protein